MKRIAILLIGLAAFAACEEPAMRKDVKYTISGVISDPASNGKRLLSGIHARVTGSSGAVVFSGPVGLTDTVSCRYSLKDIPAGEYTIFFDGPYYAETQYRLSVKGDENLNVSLSPLPLFNVGTEQVRLGPRVQSQEFTLSNISGKDIAIALRPDPATEKGIKTIKPDLKYKMPNGWYGHLAAGETKTFTIEAVHEEIGLREGTLRICAGEPSCWIETSIPLSIETSGRDFYANVVGTVVDNQGNPLKDILIYCECTGTTTLTDENGRYGFEDLPYRSRFHVTALPEYYQCKDSETFDYVVDEIVADLTLEPSTNHLVLDHDVVDFGTGSISGSDSGKPEIIKVMISLEKDNEVYYRLTVYDTSLNPVVTPGLNYSPTYADASIFPDLYFQLGRTVSDVGTHRYTALLKTDTAGAYFIPVTYTNTD